jgi:hypothetical protein
MACHGICAECAHSVTGPLATKLYRVFCWEGCCFFSVPDLCRVFCWEGCCSSQYQICIGCFVRRGAANTKGKLERSRFSAVFTPNWRQSGPQPWPNGDLDSDCLKFVLNFGGQFCTSGPQPPPIYYQVQPIVTPLSPKRTPKFNTNLTQTAFQIILGLC